MFSVGLDALFNLSIYNNEHSLFETELILSGTLLTSLRSYSTNNSLNVTKQVIVGSLLGDAVICACCRQAALAQPGGRLLSLCLRAKAEERERER